MVIACDIDNVLNNLQEAVTKLFNERYNTCYTLNDFHDYDVANVLPVKEAIAMKEMFGEHGIYDYVKPLAGAQESLQKLVNDGYQIYLVTDALPQNYCEKLEWVKHFFPFIDASHVVVMKHKHLFKCDVMIEDHMQNLLAGVHYARICKDAPWNRKVHDHVYDIHRCERWNEIINVIKKINEEE